ncbi:hypothetical protein [Fictibacillus barbaricus]|uniref:ATP-dependent Lon protease n=1 Tax=Fictibacillus barbaricus TaxID=182136 RepID=A0ABS2ZF45_9BACL|nr:hypothetical protein [Fictibacillus barbaricus]MBN3546817.1 hypothetical protein [Fictibacillus barbaricus]GGB44044.1 hypothetical protein GCM10007199_06760 [Fictibacillus barbaricus]
MYLLLSIFLSGILGAFLLMIEPHYADLIAFAIVAGCLFRGIYLLNDLNKRLNTIAPKKDKVQEAYENYLKEKENREKNEPIQ